LEVEFVGNKRWTHEETPIIGGVLFFFFFGRFCFSLEKQLM